MIRSLISHLAARVAVPVLDFISSNQCEAVKSAMGQWGEGEPAAVAAAQTRPVELTKAEERSMSAGLLLMFTYCGGACESCHLQQDSLQGDFSIA